MHTAFETREERRASVKPVQPAIMITVGFLSGALLWGSGVFGTTDPTPVALIPTIIALVLAVVNARRSGDRTRSGRSSLGA